MKKILLFTMLFAFVFALSAQITQERADEIVLERIDQETQPYIVYAKEGVQTETTITTANGEILELDYSCWVYYVSANPNSRYLIVNESNGNLLEINTKNDAEPDDLEGWRIATGLACGRIDITEDEFITMQILPENIEFGLPVKVRVENHTKEDLTYSTDFSLEYFNENEWEKTSSTVYHPNESILFSGKTTEEQVNLYSYIKGYNKTKRGRYRIIKNFECSSGTYNLCAEFYYNPEYQCGRIDINEDEYVTMQVLPEKISINTPHTFRLENHTRGVLTYGHPYSLEYFNGNDWVNIPLDFIWPMNQLGLGAGEMEEDNVNYYLIEYNNGKKGKYRIIKEFSVAYNFPNNSATDPSFNLCVEFEIE